MSRPVARICVALLVGVSFVAAAPAECPRPVILVTGYWPPTNEMLREWSTNPAQNPGGWVGENWENRGYDIYAHFPEFPGGTATNPKGNGDFEVDYQDTSADWWLLLPQYNPIAIVTTSRANTLKGWEMEVRHKKFVPALYTNDYVVPLKPDASLPIFNEPNNFVRFSSLPMQAIVDAVGASGADVDPFITPDPNDFGGAFLSGYIGYHGVWWHDLHLSPNDPAYNVCAGHIHVGMDTDVAAAVTAMRVTLRTVIDYVDSVRGVCVGDLNGSGTVDDADLGLLLAEFNACGGGACVGDLNCDGATDDSDLGLLLSVFGDDCR